MTARKLIATVAGWCACALVVAAPAHAAFGDVFGVALVNQPGVSSAAAFPGGDAFWAGTCRIDRAPAPGGAVPEPGVGVLPTDILVPNSNSGFGSQVVVAAPPSPPHCIDWGGERYPDSALWAPGRAPAWRLAAEAQAGSHPDGTATFVMRRGSGGRVDGTLDDVIVDLPAGFVGDPKAVPKCSGRQFAARPLQCPPQTQVGVLHLQLTSSIFGNIGGSAGNDLEIVPVFNLQPRRGNVAELGFGNLADINVTTARIVAKARTNGDFGVTTFVGQIPAALPVISQAITIWGVPWAGVHDLWRAPLGLSRSGSGCNSQPGTAFNVNNIIPPAGLVGAGCAQSYDPSWGEIRPFLSNLTECDPSSPVTTLLMDSYQHQGARTGDGDPDPTDPDWKTYHSPADPVTGCQKPPFAPQASFVPTSTAADSPSGLSVDIRIPQNRDLPFAPPAAGASQGDIDAYVAAATDHWASDAGLATAQLDKTVVTLPDGVSVNPGAATGLVACPDSTIGVRRLGNPPLFNDDDPFDGFGVDCPNGSKIGSLQVRTPLLDETLTGEMILGEPRSTDPTSGEMFRLFLLVRNKERGLVAKIYGSTVADPATGRLTTTFDNNPRVPFEDLHLDVRGGSRGLLSMPQACGPKATVSVFDPWTAAHGGGGPTRTIASPFSVAGDCSRRFVPRLQAGMDRRDPDGRGGRFSFKLTRQDGEQWLYGLTAKLPKGLLGSVKGLPLCTDAQAAAAACPAASRLGSVDAGAGTGDQFFLEQKGDIYLTDGYKGCPYGLAVKVRPIAGPFRGPWELSPIVVRQAVCVNRRSGQVSAVSDPFPLIHHGIPLRVREVLVNVDRPAFMRNPTGCRPKRVRADLTSPHGAAASPTTPFQVSGCSALRFKPKLKIRLTGRRQTKTGRHPGVRAKVTQRTGEAAISKAVVRLPKSLALDVNNAQALCEFDHGTKPDLENHCPKGSIVGRARAITPLLNDPLVGNVYFVKNVRIDKQTGNTIRTLPMIVVALRGEIAINLRGLSNTTRGGKLVNKFKAVPDAPVSRFNLNIRGGRNGILAVTRTRRSTINLCRRRHLAQTYFDAHSNHRHDRNIKINTPCAKKKTTRRNKTRNRRR
jgi:hypothetical protein